MNWLLLILALVVGAGLLWTWRQLRDLDQLFRDLSANESRRRTADCDRDNLDPRKPLL